MVNAEQGLTTLDPDPAIGIWFTKDSVKKTLRRSITSMMNPFVPNWSDASDGQKELWWNTFRFNYQYKQKNEALIRETFNEMAKKRIPDYVYKKGRVKKSWIDKTEALRKGYDEWKASDNYKKKAEIQKKNRYSQGENGKAAGTHTVGRKDMMQYIDKLSVGSPTPPSVPELVRKSKTSNKKGGFITNKVKNLFDRFNPRVEEHEQTQPDTPIDENQLYYEIVGAHDKKGRVYGTGSASSMYYDRPPPRHSSVGEQSTYSPGILTRLTQENRSMSQRLSTIEELIVSQGLSTQPPPTCNLGADFNLFRRGPFDGDGGSGSGGADVPTY